MSVKSKQLPFETASSVLDRVRRKGKRIVQCHGTFDLIHPGHVVHFEEARALGDVLVVTVTGESHVNKGPSRPYFSDQMRVKWLAALESVDYVIVVPHPAAVEAIECVRPHVYCKGREYENTEVDVTGNIHDDISTVERLGGEVRYVGSVVFSSTRLLNQHFDPYCPEVRSFCKALAEAYPADTFRETTNSLADIKVLVVGDLIFDRYSTVGVQGLTSKNRIISGRFEHEETQAGGALAVCRHVQQFTPHVKMVGLVGTEPWVESTLSQHLDPDADEIVRIPGFTTIVKQRFVEPLSEGKEVKKLFAVNYIDAQHPGENVQRYICERVEDLIDEYDLVLAMDFGHGVFSKKVRGLVQDRAAFLAVNCQTNSNNYGFNIINKQYRRADSLSLDQSEMCLACGRRDLDFRKGLIELRAFFGAKQAWLTRGGIETLGADADGNLCACPPLEINVVDSIGAGDAFCALVSLGAVRGLPLDLTTFMGQLAGAQAVRILGNSESIRKDRFLKASEAMLNF